ncbi:hypothetical protein AMTR_s00096p00095000 [Amborella trichopoda]|uniref:Uncharacterized protein n=1 Tax=Amborella trichopoda TaxID=13333 RepID=W1NXN8_AMBTC|nr:hypothetical protein AMTR_s00096p00095000 [Amborella trichopoda]
MGFSPELVDKLIKEHGDEDSDSLLETLLTYSVSDIDLSMMSMESDINFIS